MSGAAFPPARALLALASLLAASCTTESYCFDHCPGDTTDASDAAGHPGSGGSDPSWLLDAGRDTGGGFTLNDGSTPSDVCVPAAPGEERCGHDNDCNGEVDAWDYSSVKSCGSCSLDCTAQCDPADPECRVPQNVVNPSCEPPSVLDGTMPGRCTYERCRTNYYDFDPEQPGCESYCFHPDIVPDGRHATDQGGAFCFRDDDCDGEVDDDLPLCDDEANCGACGRQCNLPHAEAECVTRARAGEACTPANTECQIRRCDDGWHDVSADPGCEYRCPVNDEHAARLGAEICDGYDNDCDGKIDNADADLQLAHPAGTLGATCHGGSAGECALPAHAGVFKCIGGNVTCCDAASHEVAGSNPELPARGLRNGVCDAPGPGQVLEPDERPEICDGLDNDCDGLVDDNPGDAQGLCPGTDVGPCQRGRRTCREGQLVCAGEITPQIETCNAVDDDCDGVPDGTLADPARPVRCTGDLIDNPSCAAGEMCLPRSGPSDRVCARPSPDVGTRCGPPPPPVGVSSPCRQGTLVCVGGQRTCEGAILPTLGADTCNTDANCNGVLEVRIDTTSDVNHCGACGRVCAGGQGTWSCVNGACRRCPGGVCSTPADGCLPGFIDCDGDPNDCERACRRTSEVELCNGFDDDCDCQTDEASDMSVPGPSQVCGVAAGASRPECTTGVRVSCEAGSWRCAFPAGVCGAGAAPDYCTGSGELCDGLDNDCNGAVDETFRAAGRLGEPCASDDGLPAPGHGACRGVGAYVCTDDRLGTLCSARFDATRAGAELCDGVDNDCDGAVDEPFTAKGSNPAYFVQPAVTRIATSLWIYQYEASRPGATATNPGSGNGYHWTAPAGQTLDRTPACSVPGVVPWFNVTPEEAEQTCGALGGHLCSLGNWQTACGASASCTFGYAPRASCSLAGTYSQSATRICNLGLFDRDASTPGRQGSLLPTGWTNATPGEPTLANCWADWTGLYDNPSARAAIRDITGNLREIVADTNNVYRLMGGAYSTQTEAGAACDFTFYSVTDEFRLYDTGFRCCFTTDPTR